MNYSAFPKLAVISINGLAMVVPSRMPTGLSRPPSFLGVRFYWFYFFEARRELILGWRQAAVLVVASVMAVAETFLEILECEVRRGLSGHSVT